MSASLLVVMLDGAESARVAADEPPCEKRPCRRIGEGASLALTDAAGVTHRHGLGDLAGWAHVSIRVHQSWAVQADCVVTDAAAADPASGPSRGIRFQPFFLPGAQVDPTALIGQGLFARGLHFAGLVTPAWVWLSGECDVCWRSFLFRSFHAGFANLAYLYSGSGRHTLLVDHRVPGAPAALGRPDPVALAALEARLPAAPDGSRFAYTNPFRCPHCAAPYIDFARHPGLREQEYYGNHLLGVPPISYAG